KIIARLPFVERPDHPAGLPVFVIAKPGAEAAAQDIALIALSLPRWTHDAPAAVAAAKGEILASAPVSSGHSLLVALPTAEAERLPAALRGAGFSGAGIEPIGGHSARFEMDEARAGVFAPGL
ncbi:MAG TPA: hypothetical protein VMJ31_08460, partial [Methylocystis sp.]|nr:hypothetical protein [Methylocystis sp.]